jgi:hypothetical protein
MASMYRCEVKWPVRRGKGQSVVAKAAYNSRSKLHNEREDKWTRDYGKPDRSSRGQEDILFSGIFVDAKITVPEWVHDRSRLWNEASNAQGKRRDARDGGQEMILNLPNDLSFEAQRRMTIDYVREQIVRGKGRIADVNIHDAPKTGDDRNKHVHILFTIRKIGPDGFEREMLPEINRDDVQRLRLKWAERGERELRRAGYDEEADRWKEAHAKLDVQRDRALARGDKEYAQACDRQPGIHLGPHVRAMEDAGKITRKGDIQRAIQQRNAGRGRKVARGAAKSMGAVLDGVGGAIESLFTPPSTPESRAEAEAAERERLLRAEETEKNRRRDRGRDR